MKTPKTIIDILDIKKLTSQWNEQGEKIAFVPTMGALHDGHLALVRKAKELGTKVVVSIFVNPIQFGPNEDFENYPRTLESDIAALSPFSVDAVFLPNAGDLFPEGFETYVDNVVLGKELCGASREGHFRGVCTVVLKLFNIVRPKFGVFGKKDYQQLTIISKMAKDLCLGVEVVGVEIERAEDGLALSSRLAYLDEKNRELAGMIPVALNAAYDAWDSGTRSRRGLEKAFMDALSSYSEFNLDYVKVCDFETLDAKNDEINGPVVMLIAVYLSGVRLIDNIEFEWMNN